MSLADKVGQVLSAPWGLHGVRSVVGAGTDDPLEATCDLVSDLRLGGVCYFAGQGDGDGPGEVAEGVARLQEAATLPLLMACDQEGGRVRRLRRGFTAVPAARELGDDPDRVRTFARVAGAELTAVGINQVYAPVADVDSNPDNPVIADRAYSSDPAQVARCVTAAVEGFHAGGIACTAKHFPGHGDTAVDSHLAVPVVPRSVEEWRSLEAVPFRAAIAAGVDAVMLGHLVFPAMDAAMATVSATVVALLRQELGFDGLVVSDALEMEGARAGRDPDSLVVECLAAGVDQLLMPVDLRGAHAALVDAVRSGRIGQDRLDDACRRVLTLKSRLDPVAR